MTPILELEITIRDLVNGTRKRLSLSRDMSIWGKLCSSLDVIGDTEVAIEAFTAGDPGVERRAKENHLVDSGRLYLSLYGILQVLFVQQDAVAHLAEALQFKYNPDPVLKEIREIRNDAIGHPTKRRNNEAFIFISRSSLDRNGCTLLTLRSDGSTETRDIDINNIILVQRSAVHAALSRMLNSLKEEEMAHRKKFKDNKLSGVFPGTLGHTHEKIREAIDGALPREFGASLVVSILEITEAFKEGLKERGLLDASGTVAYELGLLDYPIEELSQYFSSSGNSKMNDKDARIFHFYIVEHLGSLAAMAREIDEDYDKDL